MKTLENNPALKQLLINYVSIHYEQDALFDDYNLLIEYHNLLNNNELHKLFECEALSESINAMHN